MISSFCPNKMPISKLYADSSMVTTPRKRLRLVSRTEAIMVVGALGLSYTDHTASLRAPIITLEERRQKVSAGPAGRDRRNGGVHPFKNMTKDNMIRECRGRHLPSEEGLLKPALEAQLKEELKRIQRVPALSFPEQGSSMKHLNLSKYEVVPVEPLHDLKEHINNVLKELPKHLTDEENKLFDEAVEAVLSTKEKL